MVKEVEQLTINPADYAYEITKQVKRDDSAKPSHSSAKNKKAFTMWNTIP